MNWVKIRSWHGVRTTFRSGKAVTLCGRLVPADAEITPTLPGERSCESCLRIVARRADT